MAFDFLTEKQSVDEVDGEAGEDGLEKIQKVIRRMSSISLGRSLSREDHDIEQEDETDGSGMEKEKLGLDVMSMNCCRGHFIDKVSEDSAAAMAGLQEGDQVVKINGEPVREIQHDKLIENFKTMVLQCKYGEQIELSIVRRQKDPSQPPHSPHI